MHVQRLDRRAGPLRAAVLLFGITVAATPAAAGKTSYAYDAQGRLVRVNQTSTSGSYDAQYSYDKADNRLSYTMSSTATQPVSGKAIAVVPLKGYKVIPVGR